jgi:Xaa-Pro aminopeptidase
MEKNLNDGRQDLDEFNCSEVLDNFRKMTKDNKGLSFPSISSSGPNAAINHYRPSKESARKVVKEEIYLIDSGG